MRAAPRKNSKKLWRKSAEEDKIAVTNFDTKRILETVLVDGDNYFWTSQKRTLVSWKYVYIGQRRVHPKNYSRLFDYLRDKLEIFCVYSKLMEEASFSSPKKPLGILSIRTLEYLLHSTLKRIRWKAPLVSLSLARNCLSQVRFRSITGTKPCLTSSSIRVQYHIWQRRRFRMNSYYGIPRHIWHTSSLLDLWCTINRCSLDRSH